MNVGLLCDRPFIVFQLRKLRICFDCNGVNVCYQSRITIGEKQGINLCSADNVNVVGVIFFELVKKLVNARYKFCTVNVGSVSYAQ